MTSDSANYQSTTLVVRRVIGAPPERLFEAWTHAEQLLLWWGPKDVTCTHASLDLKVGGRYQIDNRLPNGKVLSIIGEYESVDPPNELIFSWQVQPSPGESGPSRERVSVRFEDHDDGTLVIVTHERIPTVAVRDDHEKGWQGCLDGLTRYLS